MALSDVKCRNIRPASKLQKLSDGGGLQLWVQPSGTKLWRLAYRFDGKQKLLSLGSYPVISLADARQARDEAKRLRPKRPCPECGKPSSREHYPFCSARCKDIDLNRWLKGAYVIPGRDEEEDEDSPKPSPAPRDEG